MVNSAPVIRKVGDRRPPRYPSEALQSMKGNATLSCLYAQGVMRFLALEGWRAVQPPASASRRAWRMRSTQIATSDAPITTTDTAVVSVPSA